LNPINRSWLHYCNKWALWSHKCTHFKIMNNIFRWNNEPYLEERYTRRVIRCNDWGLAFIVPSILEDSIETSMLKGLQVDEERKYNFNDSEKIKKRGERRKPFNKIMNPMDFEIQTKLIEDDSNEKKIRRM